MGASLVWATPDGDKLIAFMARVSNPQNQDNEETAPRLINFLIRNRHWSPFEMVNACISIETTRDIGRQILRHRSFTFQEFSQRYAEVDESPIKREMRSKGTTNRQGSVDGTSGQHKLSGVIAADLVHECFSIYRQLLANGVAPECARAVLPEGFAPTRMYMNGTLRSWIHYIGERTQPNVQAEHRVIAEEIKGILTAEFPNTFAAVAQTDA